MKPLKNEQKVSVPGPNPVEADVDTSKNLLDSLESVVEHTLRSQGPASTARFLGNLTDRLRAEGIEAPRVVSTPYINTIPVEKQAPFPGDWEMERRLKSYVRWNAMAMVVTANREHSGLGGHISTYASAATLYEVAFNHFLRGRTEEFVGDQVYFQGHATPGIYARAFLEGRIDEPQLHNFRQELAPGGGLSSYPHPYLMPDFWQFPTVSMGLGPLLSIYQARFNRYLRARPGVRRGAEGLGFSGRRRNRRAGNTRFADAGVAGEPRQPDLGDQLQFAAPRRTGARQRQNHSGT
jgi:pyruvate dehydrogenase E1 component